MEAKDTNWCPQHGYPLPCYKCGMPLSQTSQKEIYRAGIKEVVDWLKEENDKNPQVLDGSYIIAKMNHKRWQVKLKEWEIE
ncbi:hypothetical protein LCGC14_0396330 [marine sediment metagenome]|uniref:Uncharacterized protein n=1 Tax=marine sediment metagenome TaxID=412755 RepID=A0A0F9VK15_9ZZZZ